MSDHIDEATQVPVPEEVTDTVVDPGLVRSTERTAKIRMLTTDIEEFRTKSGQITNILIVARCSLDRTEYACLFDMATKKAHVVEVERVNGIITGFYDIDRFDQDEEWATIADFFNSHHVLEANRIFTWLWNTRSNPKLAKAVPDKILRSWGIDPSRIRTDGK